ncbi:MAG TPA: T9SS type A sorting domain-containing protein, partial [Cytophagales bacterium]|nr:T9SS type A sorting domain-containing protein [Cytophagales bacterium]
APTLGTQKLVPGANYNHRFFITFPNQIATVTQHLAEYAGSPGMIHRGELRPPRMESRVYANPTGSFNFNDDWSADMPALSTTAGSSDLQTLIINDWTDPKKPNQVINKYHPEACSTTTKVSSKVLVEEWDGYTWRRIYGNAPVTGREVTGIVVKDFLPAEVTFKDWVTGFPVGTIAGKTITWPTITELLPNDSIVYKFEVTVNPCSTFLSTNDIVNIAEAKAINEPAVRDTAITTTGCGVTPLSLLNFTGRIQGQKAILTWVVAHESTNTSYILYRSHDGVHFDKITSFKGQKLGEYSYEDLYVSEPHVYYRLSIQQHGSQQSSKVIKLGEALDGQVSVYPNPFNNEVHIEIKGVEEEEVLLRVLDLAGKELLKEKFIAHKGMLIGANWPTGIYILLVCRNGEVLHIPITKY